MAFLQVDFFSDVLGKAMQMNVILPQRTSNQIGMEGSTGETTYPVLYLLHGMSDDSTGWMRYTSIERYVSGLGIAVVMPNGDLSWYTDMVHGGKYWTYLSEELPAICREFFPRMTRDPKKTFAAGLSMGGYGAMKLALKAPQTFGAAASLSGGLDMKQRLNDNLQGEEFEVFRNIFGDPQDFEGSKDDLFQLAKDLKESGLPLPHLFMWCGTKDFLYQQNLSARDYFVSLGYPVTYTEGEGSHQWKYWDTEIQNVLKWLPV